MAIDRTSGTLEIGHVTWSRAMKQSVTGTEAVWLSLLDDEWPLVDAAIQRWLAPDNFDAEGQQLTGLRTS